MCFSDVLEKIGVWTPFYNEKYTRSWNTSNQFNSFDLFKYCSNEYGVRKKLYDIYQAVIVTFTSIHTLLEIVMITYGFRELELDELTVSVAFSIQHFLGIAKVYIMWVFHCAMRTRMFFAVSNDFFWTVQCCYHFVWQDESQVWIFGFRQANKNEAAISQKQFKV